MSVALSDRRNVVLVATILGSAMAFIDATVVNVALPAIGDDLHLGLAGRQWVFLSYSLVLASLYLVAGAVGDRIGQRRVFLGGALGFAVTSALAGAAPSGAFLIGARALQGVAAAFLTTGSLALLRATFGSESGRAVGLWTAWTGITTIAGPPLGGAMVELASWRWIFYFNLPLAAAAALLAHRAAHDDIPPPDRARPFDVGGAALMAIGFAALTYALVEGASRGVGAVWWAIAVAVGGLAAAVLLEWRIDDPMLPLPLFRRRNFAVANLVTLLVYAGLGGSTFFLVLYLQTVIGYSPIQASLVMVPISVVMLLLAGRFGRLADRQGPRLYLTLGPTLMAAGMLLWGFVDDRGSPWLLAAGVGVFAVGLSVTVAPITATALAAAPERFAGVAAGVNNTVARVGGLVAVALVGLVISLVFEARTSRPGGRPLTDRPTTPSVHDASVAAFRAGTFVAAALVLAGALAAGLGISNAEARSAES